MTIEAMDQFLDSTVTITENVVPDKKIDDKINDINELESTSSQSTLAFIQDDGIDYPEGGLQAYVAVFGCFMGLVACFGLLNNIGVIETYIQHHQLADMSTSTIGWIFSIFLFFNFFTCIFSGTYFDRNGSRVPIIVGGILHCGGLLATANCTKFYQFVLAFSVCAGTGNGTLMSPLASVPSHYFNKKRGTATALATMGGSIGGIIIPLMLKSLFAKVGFAWAMRIFAFVNMACLAVAVVLARERLPPKKTEDSFVKTYILNSFDFKGLKEPAYLFCVLGCLLGEMSMMASLTYFGSYVVGQGLTENDAFLLLMVISVTGIPGRWIPGYMSDRWGRFNAAIVMISFLTLITFVVWLPFGHSLGNLYGVAVLFGFFSGSIYSLLPVCCGQISKTEDFGKRYSTMYAVVAFGGLFSGPIAGALIHIHYDYLVVWGGVTCFLSALFYIISRGCVVGYKISKF